MPGFWPASDGGFDPQCAINENFIRDAAFALTVRGYLPRT
jgi:hypothetical protein